MRNEPIIIKSSASRQIVEDGITFTVEVYKLEGAVGWSLEVITDDGTSIVWDDLFEDDRVAFEEAVTTIREEGAKGFAIGGSNIIPFKH